MRKESNHAWQAFHSVLRFAEWPDAHGADLVHLRVSFAGVCGSDVAKLTKSNIPDPGHPWVPGHEVVAVDEHGRTMVVDPVLGCGTCERCGHGEVNLCPAMRMIGWQLPGGFARSLAVPVGQAVPVPAGVSALTAVLTEPTAVAVHGVRCAVPDWITAYGLGRLAVVGAGVLGVATAAYAASLGWEVTVVVRDLDRVAPLREHVAASFVDVGGARGPFDVVVDAASGADDSPFTLAMDLVRDGGTIVAQTAYHPGVKLRRDLRAIIRRALTVSSSFSFCRGRHGDDFADALRLLAADSGWTGFFLRDRFDLPRLPEALAALTSGGGRRPVKAVLVG